MGKFVSIVYFCYNEDQEVKVFLETGVMNNVGKATTRYPARRTSLIR
jgi:hypothetical protein